MYYKPLQTKVQNVKKQHFKHNELLNCVLSAIAKQKKRIGATTLERLNKQYFNSGITFEDIPTICNRVCCNLKLYNGLGNLIYSYQCNTTKSKTVKIINNMFDHVESYENKNNTILNTKDKEIVQVDNQYLNEYVKKEHNLYNELKQIKMKFDDVIGLITHDKIYKTRTDEFFSEDEKIIANFFNQFKENEYLHINTNLCKFIRSGVHYPEMYYKINNVNLNDYITFDKNKAYYSILEGEFYNKYGFPTAIHGVYYNIHNIDAQEILQKAGYSYIKNINYSTASENIKKYFFEINLLKNDNIYPNNYLIYCYNNLNIKFDIVYTAFSNDIKKIDNHQSLLEDKIYQRIFGMCDSISGITYMIHGDPEIINTLIHNENKKESYNTDKRYL